jgi:DNA mismatch repair protein MutS
MSVPASTPDPTAGISEQLNKQTGRYANHQEVEREALTPMMRHYADVKDQYPQAILLYRVGDFFETFFQDAITVARELELVLTSKDCGKDLDRAFMAGIPHHALERYCALLVDKGYAVAICDQVEDPAVAQGLVRREVIRVITPGTVLEEGMLQARRNNFLAAIVLAGNHWGFAYADVSTGEFFATQSVETLQNKSLLEQLAQELLRIQPSEVLLPTDAPDLVGLLRPGEKTEQLPANLPNQFCYTLRPQLPFSLPEARHRLLTRFRLRSLEGLGCNHLPLVIRAAGGLLEYLEETWERSQRGKGDQEVRRNGAIENQPPTSPSSLIPLQLLRTYTLADYLTLDHQTRRNLEITQTVRDGTLYGSVLWAVDRTVTAMGGRALRRWLLQPLLNVADITDRQDTVQELVENLELRQQLQALLKDIYDLERLTGRAGSGTANARDLVALAESFGKLPDLAALVAEARSPYLSALQEVPPDLEQLGQRLRAHLSESPPLYLTEGNLIRAGVNPQLDALRQQVEADQQWIASLETSERAETGIPTLKVSYNKTFGYYISISRAKADQVPAHYIRKQTLVNEERYITPDLKEREARILSAQEEQKRLEYELFAQLRQEVGDHASTIRTVARAVAAADVLCSLAEVAVTQGYCRPQMTSDRTLIITGGRHPVVEQSLPAGFFVPNSTMLGGTGSLEGGTSKVKLDQSTPQPSTSNSLPDLIILTGPNASGKSCYLRQVGLIQLLAQVGSFVPATAAVLGVCDRIFTRVGAVDDLATGQSTFMVEMNETANILNHATERSLVLLDEIGRGTATFDGLSIAWAVAEHLASEIRARTIFATHYHELNELASILPNVANYQVTVKELPDQIIFLHQVRPGGADRSYGIEAGRLAGLPPSVIQRARQVMSQIEKHSRIAIGLRKGSSGSPTVREKRPPEELPEQPTKQLGIFDG